jgi:hypothetical protein
VSTTSIPGFFSPHYIPAVSLTTHQISHFSTYPPLYSDNKPSNKPSNNNKPPPPSTTSTPSSSTLSSAVPSPTDDSFKPVVTPAWNELMTILSKHVYDSAWTPEAQARYTHIIKQYPYISPETQYTTGLPIPGGMTPREACQSAAEEALFADYRPLRAGFGEDYIDSGEEELEGEVTFDTGNGVMHFPISTAQLFEVLGNVVGKDVTTLVRRRRVELTSTRRKQRIKIKKHKRRKL